MKKSAGIGPVLVDFAASTALGVNAPMTHLLVQFGDRIDLAAHHAGAAAAAGHKIDQNRAIASGCSVQSAVTSLSINPIDQVTSP
jgi:hypothetical protein